MSDNPQDTFVSHLVELRNRLVVCLIVFGVILVPLVTPPWFIAGKLYDFLAAPMMAALPQGSKMIATGVIAPFFIPLKIAMMTAFLIALPVILYQLWAFVAPGLYKHEKRFVLPLIISSTVLFFVGMSFCYFFVFKMVFTFIAQLAPASINVAPDIENYFGFVLGMFMAFGLAFETPIVVVVLVATGMVSLHVLREVRRYVIVGAFIVAAVVTPPDVASQLALAIPLCILYEIGLFAARFVKTDGTADAPDSTQAT
ncbi:MAG: twin-arginine translocase subunit TatC [Rhodocyclaceae bacterium]|nr:twin-arginine translocase subunit TatC [Rhodocyclaceae bacterium]MCA3033293.1 twin-arginine translocase subunit TatC [Rhodocyclaceae bacterium]MCA3036076.1 twin-arginine translocase subunit TatC [Rhodocyclaceae bacterium]MCA3039886.1 twin-arginine translocase subunit TatC [Rhodocyclaceae bacterium]MCA3046065.1 twin-arginine translocase subunit TatC [Rhodocyclaceae bacterium]